ncbi:hypothetical protein DND34_04815 [Bifidobacterium longum subsp. longum]|nr:hypothetical protein DND34_04815 [Bifidobacterium longum subsp. longum]TBR82619.1 hypothetical protein DNR84_11120 [Bifidobacterium longum subsp. longum]
MLLMPRTNPDTGQTACGMVSLETIAAWGELLGTGSDVETVAAIMQAKDPGIIDRETARHAWTSAYEQVEHDALEDLNQVRAASLHRAFTPTGALAPDGRAETRRLLGLDSTVTDPYEADAAIAAAQAVAESTTDEPEPSIRLPAGVDATSLETLLAEHATEIDRARTRFLNDVTPTITDRR